MCSIVRLRWTTKLWVTYSKVSPLLVHGKILINLQSIATHIKWSQQQVSKWLLQQDLSLTVHGGIITSFTRGVLEGSAETPSWITTLQVILIVSCSRVRVISMRHILEMNDKLWRQDVTGIDLTAPSQTVHSNHLLNMSRCDCDVITCQWIRGTASMYWLCYTSWRGLLWFD